MEKEEKKKRVNDEKGREREGEEAADWKAFVE